MTGAVMFKFAKGLILALLLFSASFPHLPAAAAEEGGSLLPSRFGDGWMMEGEVATYKPNNLYMYIDGEAELYMPFGFETLRSAAYVRRSSKEPVIVADVYRMGSLLDAFGIYSYYRNPDAGKIPVGVEGFAEESQAMFYKDRYFVRLNASGAGNPPPEAFLACARGIGKLIPGAAVAPKELALLNGTGVVESSVRYIAKSVLGYGIFRKGLAADADVNGVTARVFVVLDESPEAAKQTLSAYVNYLKEGGAEPEQKSGLKGTTVSGHDPMYKGIILRQTGRYVIGVTKIPDPSAATPLMERLQEAADRTDQK
jgi:hypothetical protein